MIIRTPIAGRVRFMNDAKVTLQAFHDVRSTLTFSNIQTVMSALNSLRRFDEHLTRGDYTVTSELVTA
jgi:uncharacterized membrane protein